MKTQTTLSVPAVLAAAATASAAVSVDFSVDQFANPLINGQEIVSGAEFGSPFDISSPTGSRLAIFDTDPAGPNAGGPDTDLLVGQGNALIIQENSAYAQTAESGVFDVPNDEAGGGEILFSFNSPAELLSLTLIDINGGSQTNVILLDNTGLERRFNVPAKWTFDPDISGNGFATLNLQNLAPQFGEPGAAGGAATAVQDAGFDQSAVVSMTVDFSGSGAIGSFEFIPAPGSAALAAFAGLAATRRRR